MVQITFSDAITLNIFSGGSLLPGHTVPGLLLSLDGSSEGHAHLPMKMAKPDRLRCTCAHLFMSYHKYPSLDIRVGTWLDGSSECHAHLSMKMS